MASFIGKPQELVQWLFAQDRDKVFEVKERRQRRSLTQNSYYWVLVNKLARAVDRSDTEVHRMMLADYGVASVYSVLEDVPFERYFKYCEKVGEGVANGKRFNHVKGYLGSSKMDRAEFGKLLDGIIYECQQVGVETMTPQELARLEFIEPKED